MASLQKSETFIFFKEKFLTEGRLSASLALRWFSPNTALPTSTSNSPFNWNFFN